MVVLRKHDERTHKEASANESTKGNFRSLPLSYLIYADVLLHKSNKKIQLEKPSNLQKFNSPLMAIYETEDNFKNNYSEKTIQAIHIKYVKNVQIVHEYLGYYISSISNLYYISRAHICIYPRGLRYTRRRVQLWTKTSEECHHVS